MFDTGRFRRDYLALDGEIFIKWCVVFVHNSSLSLNVQVIKVGVFGARLNKRFAQ